MHKTPINYRFTRQKGNHYKQIMLIHISTFMCECPFKSKFSFYQKKTFKIKRPNRIEKAYLQMVKKAYMKKYSNI